MSMEKFKELQEEQVVLSGVVRLVQFDQELETDVVMVEVEGQPVLITREELELKVRRRSLVDYIGQEISFKVLSVDEEAGLVLGTARQLKIEELDGLAKELEEGAVKVATITKILPYGAYLEIDGQSVQMLNKDFSEDYTTIRDVLDEGDTIEVVFTRYTPSRNLRVEAKQKFASDSTMSFDLLSPNQVVLGVVRNVKPWGCYVCVAPNLDALCPVPPNMDIQEGDKVTFKITQVRNEEKRVRGKIIKKIEY